MESMTVSSSVYHGECDSIQATGEEVEDAASPTFQMMAHRSKFKKPDLGTLLLEDALVGHEFGERPLLADDELDDDRISSSVTSEKSILRLATARANQFTHTQ